MGNSCLSPNTDVDNHDRDTPPPDPSMAPSSPPQEKGIVIALFDYESTTETDLSFEKGDRMELLEDRCTNEGWWYVHSIRSRRRGYVPKTFVAREPSLEDEPWYAGPLSRPSAEMLVLQKNLAVGTFLIRLRQAEKSEYALTVRDKEDARGGNVKHYRIVSDNGTDTTTNRRFYIAEAKKFATLRDLVKFYEKHADGLCSRLTNAAPRLQLTPDLTADIERNFEVPRQHVQLLNVLGSGNFGEVKRGKWRGIVDVAVKTLKENVIVSSDSLLAEAGIMKKCNHPNLVKLYGVCSREEPFLIITEFMENGALLQYMKSEDGRRVMDSLEIQLKTCEQVASGMHCLEQNGIAHCDLAARNVLVGKIDGKFPLVKVADFGMAHKTNDDHMQMNSGDGDENNSGGGERRTRTSGATHGGIPVRWAAPEAISTRHFTIESDVWSFGVLLFEIFTLGEFPYKGMGNKDVIERVSTGYRLSKPSKCPPEHYELMEKCWMKNPQQRPTFKEIVDHFENVEHL